VRWWGSFKAAIHNVSHDAFQVCSHVASGNTDRLNSLRERPGVAAFVPLRPISEVMRHPVNFNRHCGGLAKEVEHERTKRMLSSKLQSFGAQPQDSPERDL
jgi:hypothetical protein